MRTPQRSGGRDQLPRRGVKAIWGVVLLDAMNACWMMLDGDWLDRQPTMISASTWGGHHRLVLGLAVAALVSFGVLAPVTAGFTRATRVEEAAIATTCFAAVLALGGLMAAMLPLAAGLLVVAVAARLFR